MHVEEGGWDKGGGWHARRVEVQPGCSKDAYGVMLPKKDVPCRPQLQK